MQGHPYSKAALGLVALIALISAGAAAAPSVVLNEIAWGGTAAGSQDEWIELRNCTGAAVDLAGWVLAIGEARIPLSVAEEGTAEVRRSQIPANGYLLLERTDDTTVSDVEADVLYRGALSNVGGVLQLLDAAGRVVDEVACADAGWPAGSGGEGTTPYATMERVDPIEMGDTWRTNDGVVCNGHDAAGSPLLGTPGAANSATVEYLTAPRVQLLAFTSNEIACPVAVEWQAVDPDGLAAGLLIAVSVRIAGTEEWTVLADGQANQGAFTWDCSSTAKDTTYELRVTATDWEGHAGSATTAPFSLR